MIFEALALLACLSAPAVAAASSSKGGSKTKSSDSGNSGSGGGCWSVGQPSFPTNHFGTTNSLGQLNNNLGCTTPPALSHSQGLQSQVLPSSILGNVTTESLGPPLTNRSLDFGPKPLLQDDEESLGQMLKRHSMIEDTYRRCRASGLL